LNNQQFEPIRVRIMQEAYELADRGDPEGYNAIKTMCGDVQQLLKRAWVGLTPTKVKLLWEGVPEEAIKSGNSLNWVFYTHINEALKDKNT